MKKLYLHVLALSILAGCATPYQPMGFLGGYSETQLDENVFQVSFDGNGFTSEERASEYCLLRSAELALQHGFSHFIIVDAARNAKRYTLPTTLSTNDDSDASSYEAGVSGHGTTTTHRGQTYVTSFPQTRNTIVCFKEEPEADGDFFDAKFVRNSIRWKHRGK